MRQKGDGQNKQIRFKTVRNVFMVYLFSAVVTDRYEIFAAICASFPFILPLLFDNDGLSTAETALRTVVYGVAGIVVSVVFMLITKTYSTAVWLIPGMYSMLSCAGFLFVQKKLSTHRRTVMKCIITVFVCLLAFV